MIEILIIITVVATKAITKLYNNYKGKKNRDKPKIIR